MRCGYVLASIKQMYAVNRRYVKGNTKRKQLKKLLLR